MSAFWVGGACVAPAASLEPPLPPITASKAIVVDRDTGLVLGAKDPDATNAMRSTAKMMTALLTLERTRLPVGDPARLSLNDTVTISDHAVESGDQMGLDTNDQVSVRDLLHGMLLPSGNDAAVALAERISGSESSFVSLMNDRGLELGLTNTVFEHPAGRSWSTAREHAKLARFILQDPLIAQIVSTATYTTTTWVNSNGVPKNKPLSNSNHLLSSDPYPGANGVKTGTGDCVGGNCDYATTNLVASAGVPGKQLVSVVLHSNSDDDRYADSKKVLDFGFSNLVIRLHPTSLVGGDFNQDGLADLVVGMPYETVAGHAGAGKVVVYYSTAEGQLDFDNPVTFTQDSPGVSGGAEWGDGFGFALAVGDFDNNGSDDLAIGVPFEDLGSVENAGAMHIIYSDGGGLNPSFREQLFAQDDQGDGDLLDMAQAGDLFGYSLAVGDFNDDGYADLAVGAPEEDIRTPAATDGGVVQVIYGSATGLDVTGNQWFHQSSPASMPGTAEEGDRFGFALAAGDFDGNGYDDLAIGAPFEDVDDMADAGHVSIIYAHAGGLDPDWKVGQLHQDLPDMPGSAQSGDFFGDALAVGDFDYNGRADLAMGVPGEDYGAAIDSGEVDVVYSDATGLNPSMRGLPAQQWHQSSAGIPDQSETGDRFGAALATGDFDNSRMVGGVRDDLAIGIPGEDLVRGSTTLSNVGAVLVLYARGSIGLTNNPAPDFLTTTNPIGDTMAKGPGEQYGTVLAAGLFHFMSGLDLAWGVRGQHWDGARLRSGYTLLTYSGILNSGLDTNTTVAADLWLRECCEGEPLPLRVTQTGVTSTRRIWNRLVGTDRRWEYEGREYTVAASSRYPVGYSNALNRTLCSDHFHFYFTDSGTDAVTNGYVRQMAGLLEEAWNSLTLTQGFRSPMDLQAEGRYSEFEAFQRIPVLVFTDPDDGQNHTRAEPAIFLKPDLAADSQSPFHEFFHIMHYGYTDYHSGWLLEGLARWAQKFKSGAASPCDYTAYRPLTYNYLTREYCHSAPWCEYFGLKYGASDTQGSDVARAILEELGHVGDDETTGAMLAFEVALDSFPRDRTSGYGNAFAEWAAGNYVDDTVANNQVMRPDAPLLPRQKLSGLVAPGGNEYLWREYTFRAATSGPVTIQVRASAGPVRTGGDDDLRFKLDGEVIADWNTANAFDGATLQGKIKTVHIVKPDLSAGLHTLRLEADASPVLYSINVFEGAVPLLRQESIGVRTNAFVNQALFAEYDFVVDSGTSNVTFVLSGIARSAATNSLTEGHHDADDAKMRWRQPSGVTQDLSGWFSEGALDGEFQEGDLATVEVRQDGFSAGTHTLQIFIDGRPTLSELAIYPTPVRPPLLQVRFPKVDPWGVNYFVVPITQELLDSGCALQIDFDALQWSGDPPFLEILDIAADGELVDRSWPQQLLGTTRLLTQAADFVPSGKDGRITFVTSGPGSGGTAEIITRRPFLNEPPVISVIPNQFIREGETLTFTAIATDPDVPASRLRYELPNAPAGARIDPNTGVFTWTPTEAQGPGANLLTVFVYDDGTPSLNDSTSFTVSVTEVNTAPALPPITSRTLHAGMPLSFTVTATDADLPPNTLSYALNNAPPGVTIDAKSGQFTWPAGAAPANTTNLLTVTVTDNGVPPLNDTRDFSVILLPAPSFTGTTFDGAKFQLTWSAIPRVKYRVQYKADLGEPRWQDLSGEIPAISSTAFYEDMPGRETQRFYRVLVLP